MSIKIEKNIPIPGRANGKARGEKYPELRQLEIGDSFAVTIGVSALSNHTRRVAKETGRKFLVRPVTEKAGAKSGARVWRKA